MNLEDKAKELIDLMVKHKWEEVKLLITLLEKSNSPYQGQQHKPVYDELWLQKLLLKAAKLLQKLERMSNMFSFKFCKLFPPLLVHFHLKGNFSSSTIRRDSPPGEENLHNLPTSYNFEKILHNQGAGLGQTTLQKPLSLTAVSCLVT